MRCLFPHCRQPLCTGKVDDFFHLQNSPQILAEKVYRESRCLSRKKMEKFRWINTIILHFFCKLLSVRKKSHAISYTSDHKICPSGNAMQISWAGNTLGIHNPVAGDRCHAHQFAAALPYGCNTMPRCVEIWGRRFAEVQCPCYGCCASVTIQVELFLHRGPTWGRSKPALDITWYFLFYGLKFKKMVFYCRLNCH